MKVRGHPHVFVLNHSMVTKREGNIQNLFITVEKEAFIPVLANQDFLLHIFKKKNQLFCGLTIHSQVSL